MISHLSTLVLVLVLLSLGSAVASPVRSSSLDSAAPAQETKKREHLKHYNLGKKGLAIQGYDPVAYFKVGGGKPAKGRSELSFTHLEVTYRFASKKNLELFKKEPANFEPVYGGWCAYAMADNDKVEGDAESFLIQNGKLHLFYDGFWADTRKKWNKDPKGFSPKADKGWKKLTKKEK